MPLLVLLTMKCMMALGTCQEQEARDMSKYFPPTHSLLAGYAPSPRKHAVTGPFKPWLILAMLEAPGREGSS